MKKTILSIALCFLCAIQANAADSENDEKNLNNKTMIVKKVNVNENDVEAVKTALKSVQETPIACVNWKEQFPSKPAVCFRIAHNGSHIFLQYFVKENEILAKTDKDNGPVWTDSCVEFFLSFDKDSYYNAEFSCIGKALLGCKTNGKAEHGSSNVMESIKRYASLGSQPFDKKEGNFEWSLLVIIPASAYWKSDIKNFDGVEAHANFYKCGDNLTVPHFLSWNPINTEKPNFHTPQFFGKLSFER